MVKILTDYWYYFSGLYIFLLYVLAMGWICLRMHARSLVDDVEVNNEQMLARGFRNESN
jgi:hypothetical protein